MSANEQFVDAPKKRGRKPIPVEDRLDGNFTIKMTVAEVEALDNAAGRLRASRSSLARQLIIAGMGATQNA